MRRTWQIQRQTSEQADGQARWDRAYQLLLRWTTAAAPEANEGGARDARSVLRARVDRAQQQVQTMTIEQQVAQLRSYAAAHPEWEGREEHIVRDDGHSGVKLDRPGLDALRDQTARGSFDLVLIIAPDRLA
jgi:predicted site-specific integrase-resolvase